jgi:RES domain-containing protein
MLTGNQLIAALASMPTLSTQGQVCRVIHIKYINSALSAIGSLQTGGRYNQKSAFQALYLADNPVTALLEVEALFKTRTVFRYVAKPPLIVLSIYYQLNAILDLTNLNNQLALGTNLQELTGNWLLMNAGGQLAPTQILGEAAYSLQSIEALKVPSARDPNNYNLVVFPDRLSYGSFLRVYDDSGTINAQLP